MLTKSVLEVKDLLSLVQDLWERNKRGTPFTLAFFDAEGKSVSVSWVEVAADAEGLVFEPNEAKEKEPSLHDMLYPQTNEILALLARGNHGG